MAQVQVREPARRPLAPAQPSQPAWAPAATTATPLKREKRQYRKRKHLKAGVGRPGLPGLLLPGHLQDVLSSDDDRSSLHTKQSDPEQEEEEMDGPFTFKRKAGVEYHPVQDEQEEELEAPYHLLVLPGGVGGRRSDTCVGFGRRRLGRGGRVVLDRIPSRWEGGGWEGGGWEGAVRPVTPPHLEARGWERCRPRGVLAGV